MAILPTDRTIHSSGDDHVADHNEIHRLHDILNGSTVPSMGSGTLSLTYNGHGPFNVSAVLPVGYNPLVGGTVIGVITIGTGGITSGMLSYGVGPLSDGQYAADMVIIDGGVIQHLLLRVIWTEDVLLMLPFDFNGEPLPIQWGNNVGGHFAQLNPDGGLFASGPVQLGYGSLVQTLDGNGDVRNILDNGSGNLSIRGVGTTNVTVFQPNGSNGVRLLADVNGGQIQSCDPDGTSRNVLDDGNGNVTVAGTLTVNGTQVGAIGQVLNLSYAGNGPFPVPCFGVPAGWNGSGIASLGAQLLVGTNIASGVLLDLNSTPIPDGWSFPATIFVEGSTIFDIIATNAYLSGVAVWGAEGGEPTQLWVPGGISTSLITDTSAGGISIMEAGSGPVVISTPGGGWSFGNDGNTIFPGGVTVAAGVNNNSITGAAGTSIGDNSSTGITLLESSTGPITIHAAGGGHVVIAGLPSSDPHAVGALYTQAGVLMVSSG